MAVAGLPKLNDIKNAVTKAKEALSKYNSGKGSLKSLEDGIGNLKSIQNDEYNKLKNLRKDMENKTFLNVDSYNTLKDTYNKSVENYQRLTDYLKSDAVRNDNADYRNARDKYNAAYSIINSNRWYEESDAYKAALEKRGKALQAHNTARDYFDNTDYLKQNSDYQNKLNTLKDTTEKYSKAQDFANNQKYLKDNSDYNNRIDTLNNSEKRLNELNDWKNSEQYLRDNGGYNSAINAANDRRNDLRNAEKKMDDWNGDRSGSSWDNAVRDKQKAEDNWTAARNAIDAAKTKAEAEANKKIQEQERNRDTAKSEMERVRDDAERNANTARENAEREYNKARETEENLRNQLYETAKNNVDTTKELRDSTQSEAEKALNTAREFAQKTADDAQTVMNAAENRAVEAAYPKVVAAKEIADANGAKLGNLESTLSNAAGKLVEAQDQVVSQKDGLLQTAEKKYGDAVAAIDPDLQTYNAYANDVVGYAKQFRENLADISSASDVTAAKSLFGEFNKLIDAGDFTDDVKSKITPHFDGVKFEGTQVSTPETPASAKARQLALQGGDASLFSNIDPTTGLPLLNRDKFDSIVARYGNNVKGSGKARAAFAQEGWNMMSDSALLLQGPAILGLSTGTYMDLSAGGIGNYKTGIVNSKGQEATNADYLTAAKQIGLDGDSYTMPIKFVPAGYAYGQVEKPTATNSAEYTNPKTGETYLARINPKTKEFDQALDTKALYADISEKTKDLYYVANAIENVGANKATPHAGILYKANADGVLTPVLDDKNQPIVNYYEGERVHHAGASGQLAELMPLIQMAAMVFAPQLGGMLNSAIGGIQVSAAVAPTAFTMGLPAVTLAQTIGATGVSMLSGAIQNMVTSGLTGGDIGQAALTGALGPALAGNSTQLLNRVGIDQSKVDAIASATNTSSQQVSNMLANALTVGVTGVVLGDPNALENAATSLAGQYVGTQAQNLVYDTMKGADPKIIAATVNAAGNVSNIATQTLINGGDVGEALKNAAPAIITGAAKAGEAVGKPTTTTNNQVTSPSDLDVVSGTTDSQRFPLQNDLNTDPDSLSNEARIFYEKAVEQGMNEQDALVVANAMENQKTNPYYGVQYGPELAKLSQQTQNKILSVSPANTKAFAKNFNEAIDQEIALGSKGGLTPNGDGTYSDINEGATYYKDPKTGDWEVHFTIDTGVEGGVGVPGGTGSGNVGGGGGANAGVGGTGTGTTIGGTGVVPGGTGTSSGSIINPDGTLTGTGTINDPKNIQEVFDPYERIRSDAEDYNINVLFSMGTATPGASGTALIGPGSSTNVKDYAKSNPNEFRLFAKDVFVKNNLPQDALSYVDVTLLSPELKNKIAGEISAKVVEAKAPVTEPVVESPVTPPVTPPVTTAPTTPTDQSGGGGGDQGASSNQTATSGGTPGGGTTQDLVKTPDIPLPGGNGNGTSSGVGLGTTPSTAPGTTTSGTSAGAGTSNVINPDGTSTAGTQGVGTEGTGTQGTGTEGTGSQTAGSGNGTGTGTGTGSGSGTGAGDGAGTGSGSGTGTGIGTPVTPVTPPPAPPETTESKLASASTAPIQPVSGTSSGTDAAGTTNKSTSPQWFDKFLTTSLVPSAYSSLFDPTKATSFVGGDDDTSYLPWNEVMAMQPADNTASPLATLSTSPQQSNTQGALNMPASYYQYGDLSPMDVMPTATQTTTPNSPFTYSGATTTGALSMPQFTMAHGGGVPPTAALFAAKGGNIPHKGSHYVQGAGGGQDDLIDARLADGEYVFDADIVAAIGDGSNAEGARRLDEMRKAIRMHKRGAPNDKIPPKAKSPLAYLRGVK